MTENQLQILTEAKNIVTDIFKHKVNPRFVFHNLEHTRQVATAAEEIGEYYQLGDDDQFILLISAWFHDTGFITGRTEGHEKESIKVASDFLQRQDTDEEIMLRVSSCIQSTQMPHKPVTLAEQIICDADLYHLGTNKFCIMTERVRNELQTYFNKELSREDWGERNIDFLQSHKYFTGYCQQKLEPVKQGWIKKLQNTRNSDIKDNQ